MQLLISACLFGTVESATGFLSADLHKDAFKPNHPAHRSIPSSLSVTQKSNGTAERQGSSSVQGPIVTDKALQDSYDPVATYQKSLGQLCIYTASTAALLIVVALVYRHMKKDPEGAPSDGYEHKAELLDRRWRFGLFDCFGDLNVCCFTCCCPAIRWADTMRMAGYLGFWTAFILFMGLQLLSQLSAGITGFILLIVLIVYRQRQRRLFEMQNGTCGSYIEDCLTYGCCSCCALIQEARQFEEAWAVDHVAIREARLQ